MSESNANVFNDATCFSSQPNGALRPAIVSLDDMYVSVLFIRKPALRLQEYCRGTNYYGMYDFIRSRFNTIPWNRGWFSRLAGVAQAVAMTA